MYGLNQNMRQERPVSITSLNIIEVDGYRDQYIRPFNLQVGYEERNKLEQLVGSHLAAGNTDISNIEIANATPDILLPTAAPVKRAEIINGWSEKRARWFMIAETPTLTGKGVLIYYLSGYTDYWGVSNSGALDENMVLYVNTVIEAYKTFNANTQRYNVSIRKYYNIAHQSGQQVVEDMSSLYNPDGKNANILSAMSPEDILSSLNAKQVFEGYFPDEFSTSTQNIITPNSDRAIAVNRMVTDPTAHVAVTMSSLLKSSMLNNLSYGGMSVDNVQSDLLNRAANMVRTTDIYDLDILKLIANKTNYNNPTMLTLGSLKLLDPTLDKSRITAYTKSSSMLAEQQNMNVMNQMGAPTEFFSEDSEDLSQPTEYNRMATLVAEALMNLLSKYALSTISIMGTNVNGQPSVKAFTEGSLIPDLDAVLLLERARIEFETTVFSVLSRNNLRLVEVIAFAGLTADISITLSIDGGTTVKYSIPSMADGLFNPIVGPKPIVDQVVNDYKTVVDSVTNVVDGYGN